MTEHCIVCGMEIPEGRQVCPICAYKAEQQDEKGMTDLEAFEECRRLVRIVEQHAAVQGGLWVWLGKKDPRLYRTLQTLQYRRYTSPTLLTMVKALDAAGYRLEVVPK